MNTLESCTKICGFNAIVACGEKEGGKDLKDACEQECLDSGDYSVPNASLLGWLLIGKEGCDKFFPMKRPQPVVEKLTTEEMVAIGVLAVSLLVFVAILPKPVFI